MEITYREALNQALREEMERDGRVFICGEEVGVYEGAYKVTRGLMAEFGEGRVCDTPISEEAIAGIGIGAAMMGLRPVVEMMTVNFSILALDQIVNHAAKICYMSGGQFTVPVVIRAPNGGGLGLGAQHSQSLESYFVHVPGLKVVTPSTPYDAKGLLKSAIRDDNPVIFLENEILYGLKGEVPEEEYLIPLGSADVKRPGRDLTILSYNRMAIMSLEGAKLLEKEGIEAEVLDLRSLRPLDLETVLTSICKTNRVLVVQEGWRRGGLGGDVASIIYENAFDELDAPVKVLTGAEAPAPYSRRLELAGIPSAESIAGAARELLDSGPDGDI